MSNKETVVAMFKDKKSLYDISLSTGISYKEASHYIAQETAAQGRAYKAAKYYEEN